MWICGSAVVSCVYESKTIIEDLDLEEDETKWNETRLTVSMDVSTSSGTTSDHVPIWSR